MYKNNKIENNINDGDEISVESILFLAKKFKIVKETKTVNASKQKISTPTIKKNIYVLWLKFDCKKW